jgi:lipopolysaccharide biosynthesis glycosyltransferase
MALAAEVLDIFIGFDPRELEAADVCRKSIERRSSKAVHIQFLRERALRFNGFYDRPWTVENGQKIDTRDGKPFSTDFSFTRFLVPALMQHDGVALFCDCDFLFTRDIALLFERFDPSKAVQVVKHHHVPTETEKMDAQVQTKYWRKNWSSLVLWNCAHPANMRLSPREVNHQSGQWLHSFGWLEDHEIGDLPHLWNFLVGVDERPLSGALPNALHWTLGGPWFEEYRDAPYADLWRKERASLRAPGRPLPTEHVEAA